MKESTKLILMGLGAGVAANMLLAPTVAGATASMPMVAAGGEGVVALGAGYYAYKHMSSKGGKVAAVVAGAAAGLLVSSVQSGALSKPAGATPQSASVKPGSALPTVSVSGGAPAASALPVSGTTVVSLPGFTSVSGSVPPGSSLPSTATPSRPPTTAEINAYNAYQAQSQAAQEMEMAANLQRQQAEIAAQQGVPIMADQSGAAARLGMGPKGKRKPGLGGRF